MSLETPGNSIFIKFSIISRWVKIHHDWLKQIHLSYTNCISFFQKFNKVPLFVGTKPTQGTYWKPFIYIRYKSASTNNDKIIKSQSNFNIINYYSIESFSENFPPYRVEYNSTSLVFWFSDFVNVESQMSFYSSERAQTSHFLIFRTRA